MKKLKAIIVAQVFCTAQNDTTEVRPFVSFGQRRLFTKIANMGKKQSKRHALFYLFPC